MPRSYNPPVQRVQQLIQLIPKAEQAGLINMSGGAFAVRGTDGYYVTPQRTGEQWNWKLTEQDLILFPGGGEASMSRAGRRPCRESRLLRAILSAFPHWHAVYHGHPWGLLGYCLASQPLPVPPHLAYPAVGGERALSVPYVHYNRDEEKGVTDSMKKPFDHAHCGAVLVSGWGPFVAGEELEPVLSFAESLEMLARAQMWRLKAP
jgi:ribulose-5-phosphate 4-epimerase/fuculose-1-phosphate aldolase